MSYLGALLVAYVLGVLALLRLREASCSRGGRVGAVDRDAVLISTLAFSGAVMFGAPLLGSLLRGVANGAGPLGAVLSGPVLIAQLAMGSSLMLAAAVLMIRQWHREGGAIKLALMAAMAGVGVVGGMTSASQLSFMGEDAGVAYLEALEEVTGEISDVSCPAGLVAIRQDEEARLTHYRCPSDWMMLTYRMEPIVPWPHYRDGASSELYEALDRVMGSAIRVGQP